MKSVLLHSCCGPCSTAVIEKLVPNFDVTVFYYNPNIDPKEEYEHRKSEQIRLCNSLDVKVIEGDYIPEEYYEAVKGFEDEPEGGARCRECFYLRLKKTAELAQKLNFDFFDTTLSVSPHKNFNVINEVGSLISKEIGIDFLGGNYKKQDGYKRSVELSKEYELYRQDYCGCKFANWHLKEDTKL